MILRHMRRVRIILSILMVILFCMVFLNGGSSLGKAAEILLSCQFMPSLVRFVSSPGITAGAGFVFIVIITMVFGRVYCAILCPLGILQDILIRLSQAAGIKKAHVFHPRHTRIQFSMAVLALACVLWGFMDVAGLLDPVSLFGRTVIYLVKPAFIILNNLAAALLETGGIYIVLVKKPHFVPLAIWTVTVLSFILILIFSLFYGRLYCNTLCPAGAIIGLISRRSLFRFSLDREKCVSCGACETLCKPGCINLADMRIDSSRCLSCFNCVDVCPKGAAAYKITGSPFGGRSHVPGRRRLLAGCIAAGASMAAAWYSLAILSGNRSRGRPPVLPPGARNHDRFSSACLGCHLCVSACPTHVLAPPAGSVQRLSGPDRMLAPELNFSIGFCDFNCHACGQACPTSAIEPLALEQKKRVRIGKAALDKERCIVHIKKKHCGACGEACPTHAISAADKGQVLFPVLTPDYCIGCGACEYACPTSPKAIMVSALQVHEKAGVRPRENKAALPPISTTADFPF